MSEQIHIAEDTREQAPLEFDLASHHVQGLDTFDYCLWGDWDRAPKRTTVLPRWAIERKSLNDFIGSFFNKQNRQSENAKIERAARWWPLPVIYVIEDSVGSLATYRYDRFPSGKVTPEVVWAKIANLRFSGVQVIFTQTRYMAEYTIVSLLRRRYRQHRKHFAELWKGCGLI